MQIENDYDKEVYNGDIGYIVDFDPEVGELVATFDRRSVTYGFGELDTLVPAYAATIHKSQGSEYPAVIIPVLTQHYPCCSEIFSTPASPAASGSWSWSARRRRSRSRFATYQAGDAGRNSTSGFGSVGPARHSMRRRRPAAGLRSGSFQRQAVYRSGLLDLPLRLSDRPRADWTRHGAPTLMPYA